MSKIKEAIPIFLTFGTAPLFTNCFNLLLSLYMVNFYKLNFINYIIPEKKISGKFSFNTGWSIRTYVKK